MLKHMLITTLRWLRGKAGLFGLAMLWLLTGALPVAATDYFVRENGDDGAQGTSTNAAWRSIERVNRTRLQPGDRVRFEAPGSFAGNLRLSAEDAGTSNAPVVIGSFGEGRATILAGHQNGITVENAGGVAIENLIVAGAGRTNNTGYGVCCDNTLTNGQRLDGLRIANVEAHGFGMLGILVGGSNSGFEHVLVTNCVTHDNLRGGMEVAGRLPWNSQKYAHADVLVSHCQTFNNTGDPTYLKNHSGSGIVLYQIDGGVMEYCTAWNNGALCRSKGGGGVGLWTCCSHHVVIEHCESFSNRTDNSDGGGFDIDGGSVDCVLQYNYSHDNDGPGLMVYTYPYAAHADRGSIVRFNISENDARKGIRYAGLWVRSDGKGISGLEIYNNTVVIGPWTEHAALIDAHGVEARLRNNIFIARSPALPLRVYHPDKRVRFENNLYWREDGPSAVAWGRRTYSSLEEWRAHTGQETLNGEPTGFFADPLLSRHALDERPAEQRELQDMRAFRPLPGSPALAGGLDLRQKLGLDIGPRDFLGLLPLSGPFPLGAIGMPALE
ncbi:MAG TPA: right-handed parallel beta-helix repeat-containing protein [Verrucomicrobiae bacterium]|jgi:hypothetical protein|nr:right-handed parallel beta-helix repeat-containing protein [Verrucomicrobiae bacterium]